jgi:hypothetical protein
MRETYEQYMVRRLQEEEQKDKKIANELEERAWKNLENRNRKIYESPDGGKTIYSRPFGEPLTRVVIQSPEKQNNFSSDTDMVNHPPHYNKGIETTKYIDSWNMGFSQGNVIKYVTRYNLKHEDKQKQLEDLKKARWYLEDLIKMVENS